MKLISIIRKSLKEQIRNYWILILTVSVAPFFVLIYNLIEEGTAESYKILIVNNDKGVFHEDSLYSYSLSFIDQIDNPQENNNESLLKITIQNDIELAKEKLKAKSVDLVLNIPKDFSKSIHDLVHSRSNQINVEFIGDLTDNKYLMAAIWTHNYLTNFITLFAGVEQPLNLIETSIGLSGELSSFDLYVPGLLIFSLLMLMLSATIAIVVESEKQTIIRIKLSKVSAFEFLGGISIVQVLVGVVAVILTLLVAIGLGFQVHGSFILLLLIVALCAISIIAFSLIIAAFTKTVNEVLVIGNFPLFLFMFFSDVMFPINASGLFTIAGYQFKINFLLSPVHAVSALKQVLIMEESISGIIPELVSILFLTIIYFLIGVWLFKRKHLDVE